MELRLQREMVTDVMADYRSEAGRLRPDLVGARAAFVQGVREAVDVCARSPTILGTEIGACVELGERLRQTACRRAPFGLLGWIVRAVIGEECYLAHLPADDRTARVRADRAVAEAICACGLAAVRLRRYVDPPDARDAPRHVRARTSVRRGSARLLAASLSRAEKAWRSAELAQKLPDPVPGPSSGIGMAIDPVPAFEVTPAVLDAIESMSEPEAGQPARVVGTALAAMRMHGATANGHLAPLYDLITYLATALEDEPMPAKSRELLPVALVSDDVGVDDHGATGFIGTLEIERVDHGFAALYPNPMRMSFYQRCSEMRRTYDAAWEFALHECGMSRSSGVRWTITAAGGRLAERKLLGGSTGLGLAAGLCKLLGAGSVEQGAMS